MIMQSQDVVIQKLNIEYYQKIYDFILSNDNSFNPPIKNIRSYREHINKWLAEGNIIGLINTNLVVVGIAVIYATPAKYDHSLLSYFAIDEDFKGLGYSIILLRYLISYSLQKGCKGIFVQTWETNKIAVKLYKKFGFNEIGRPDNRGNGINSIQLRLTFNENTTN